MKISLFSMFYIYLYGIQSNFRENLNTAILPEPLKAAAFQL